MDAEDRALGWFGHFSDPRGGCEPKGDVCGDDDGGIFRSKDGGETWTEDLGGPEIPRRLAVTRIETHPKNQEEVVVTVASTGVPGAQLSFGQGGDRIVAVD